MFTVLIAEKEHITAIQQENKLFFEPFLENKEVAFCEWNPKGQDLYDAVPGIVDTVGRRKEWRAVIINNVSEETMQSRNPFDVVDDQCVTALKTPVEQPEPGTSLEEWTAQWTEYYRNLTTEREKVYRDALSHPLQKLTTWLCFKPEDYILNDVKEKQDVHDWAMEQIGLEGMKASARLELMERNQYKNEVRVKEIIRREFVKDSHMVIAHPVEIHCISTRTAKDSFFDPDSYWNTHGDLEYSRFADRNMYFDKMRFMVVDLYPKHHRDYRTDYVRFLASVLIFISNPVPGSAMQARRLYLLETETDETPLCQLVTSYDKKLAATYEVIENEMERIRCEIPGNLTDKAAEALFCTPKDVDVQLDESCDPDKVKVETDRGLFFDSPEDELHRWNRDYRISEKSLTFIAKQQSRTVRKSVTQMHYASEISDVDVSRLTQLQLDDVRDFTDIEEDEMIAAIPNDVSDISSYQERLAKEGEKVKKAVRRRMSKKTTLALGGICLLLVLICFIPFIVTNRESAGSLITAAVITAVTLGVLAAVMFVTLFFLRTSVTNALNEYNETANAIIKDIQDSMKRLSRFLSAVSNVRRGHSVQNYAKKNIDEYSKKLCIRKKHQEEIRRRRAILEENYRDYFGDRSLCEETMSRPYDYDFDMVTEYSYPAPFLAGDYRQVEFISSGNFVQVPFSFVTRMVVRMEGIYEY